MARGDEQLNLRLKSELKDRLREVAAANKRSLNAELTVILEQAVCKRKKKEVPNSKTK